MSKISEIIERADEDATFRCASMSLERPSQTLILSRSEAPEGIVNLLIKAENGVFISDDGEWLPQTELALSIDMDLVPDLIHKLQTYYQSILNYRGV